MTTSFGTDGIAMGTSLRHQIAWMWIAYGDQEGRTPTHGAARRCSIAWREACRLTGGAD
jgi:hypothetical protein